MKKLAVTAAGALALLAAGSGAALAGPTLDAVKARGNLECGVHLGLPGFSYADDKGVWTGLDVDLCRAVAAAVLGDAKKVKYTPTSVQQRWAVLTSGQVDLLSRNTTITFSRDASLGVNFKGINFYEGQTFIVRKKAGVKAVKDLDGGTICVAAGSTEEKTVGDYFRERSMKFTIINFAKNDDAIAAYDSERCDAYTAGLGALAGQRRKLKNPGDHDILTETISNAAEWLGVTSKNVDEMRAKSTSAEVRRLLGVEGDFGPMIGLNKDWMYNVIKQVGNYGESYERTVGMDSDLKLARGQNQLWTKGGILFTPPFQ
jgi:general L-amino acid transport system substrate-binding protein